MYAINWKIFLYERLPGFIRQLKMIAWLNSLLKPIQQLHSLFLLFRKNTNLEMKITGQVRVLRFWLNETFDYTDRRFDIVDYDNIEPLLIWGESYNSPIYLPQFMSSSAFDFVVKAPCAVIGEKVRIRSFLDKYKLAGKRYIIQWEGDCPGISLLDEA